MIVGRLMEGKTVARVGPISQVRPWHRQIARCVAAGMRPMEVAESFGYTPAQVSKILGSPLFCAEVARIESTTEDEAVSIREDLQFMSHRAIEVLDEGLDADVQSWQERSRRVEVAFGVLDRAGYGKKEQPQEHKHLHLHAEVKNMSDEELLKNVLDVTSSEVEE